MAYVNLGSMPSPKKEYMVDFPQLNGGLNLQELDYRIQNDETPEMKNLLWRDGILSSRRGQSWVNDSIGGEYHASYESLWNGMIFEHSGNQIVMFDPESGERTALYTGGEDMVTHGTFFPYNEKLYYKTKGYYVEIEYDGTDFTAVDVEGYTPVTYISCSYLNGSGTVYQPENRLSPKKTLWYNSAFTLNTIVNGDITAVVEDAYFRKSISEPGMYIFSYNGQKWLLNGTEVNILDYGVTIGGTPVNGNMVTVVFTFVSEYQLPVPASSLTNVEVEGIEFSQETLDITASSGRISVAVDKGVFRNKVTEDADLEFVYNYDALPTEGWELDGVLVDLAEYGMTASKTEAFVTGDSIRAQYHRGEYHIDYDTNRVCFFVAPRVTYPEIHNTVHVTYSSENELAYKNVMDCAMASVYGGTGALCIVMAGSETQPNAYFWNGQTSIAMDASYFPMTQYQLASDMVDPIRGFGKQQGYLIIFKNGSVGRTSLNTETVEGRMTIDLPYTPINAKIGCDLPWTIQLIENNLTWCNTESGVHFLANTSSAYENNVICISDKVKSSNSRWTTGLLDDVRYKDPEKICSHDDGYRYWLIVDGEVWLWDYYLSNYKNPAWFYFDNVYARGVIQQAANIWHIDTESRLTKFVDVFTDYGSAIDKVYRFATQYFGTYDNKKNVNSVIINMRPTTNSVVDITYLTDYESRHDLTPLAAVSWSLVPRDLSYRNLAGSGFAKVFRRKPHCRRVQYFTMRLENNEANMDMAVVSAQIYYTYQGRQR